MARLNFTTTQFTPRQAANITGVSTVRQRDFRRHGFLPVEDEGHARFDVFVLARLLFLRTMAERGIGPTKALEVAYICAAGIAWHALACADSYSGDNLRLIERGVLPPAIAPSPSYPSIAEEVVARATERGHDPEHIRSALTPEAAEERDQSDYLRRQLVGRELRRIGLRGVIPAEFFIWWADDTELWSNDVGAAFDELSHQDAKRCGPVIVLSLQSLGHELSERSQLPFFDVKVEA